MDYRSVSYYYNSYNSSDDLDCSRSGRYRSITIGNLCGYHTSTAISKAISKYCWIRDGSDYQPADLCKAY